MSAAAKVCRPLPPDDLARPLPHSTSTPQSVACTAELRRCYLAGDSAWTVEQGSILDKRYLRSLGQFDIVYSGCAAPYRRCGRRWKTLSRWSSLAVCCSLRSITIAVRSAEYGINASVDITGCRGCFARYICSTFGRPSN